VLKDDRHYFSAVQAVPLMTAQEGATTLAADQNA